MPVSTPSESYAFHAKDWQKIRHVLAGERAIKSSGTKYLPKLSDQTYSEYNSYVERALFFNASARTIQGLVGALFRKPLRIEVSDQHRDRLEYITFDDRPFDIFAKEISQEVLSLGRYGVLVDMPRESGATPYLVGYGAENIINWRYEARGGRLKLSLVVLKEMQTHASEKDEFTNVKQQQYRVLKLNKKGEYEQVVYQEKENGKVEEIETIKPKLRGKAFDFIPFVFFGPVSLSAEIERSPILDLINVNLSHYRSSADLEHGRHFTALPTPYVTAPSSGYEEDLSFKIGPSHVWLLEQGGSAGMLEFRGAGLTFIENACREKERMMAVLGARLLEDQKRGVEAAEAIRLRQTGESSTLASISETVSKGLSRALTYWEYWLGQDSADSPKVFLNKDFYAGQMDSASIQSLVAAWQAGAISFDALQNNLSQGEII